MNVLEKVLLEKNKNNLGHHSLVDNDIMAEVVCKNPKMSHTHHVDFANKLDSAKELVKESRESLSKEIHLMVKFLDESDEKVRKLNSKAKDYSEQLKNQLTRINSILGSDFEKKLTQMERFVAALEAMNSLGSTKVKTILDILGAK